MRSIVAVGLMLLAACSDPIAPPESALEITPDRAAITHDGRSMTIPFTLTNRGDVQVFVSACDDRARVAVERRTGIGWETHLNGFCLAVLSSAPLPLAAGSSLSGAVSIQYTTGEYRLRPLFSVDAGTAAIVGAPSTPVTVP